MSSSVALAPTRSKLGHDPPTRAPGFSRYRTLPALPGTLFKVATKLSDLIGLGPAGSSRAETLPSAVLSSTTVNPDGERAEPQNQRFILSSSRLSLTGLNMQIMAHWPRRRVSSAWALTYGARTSQRSLTSNNERRSRTITVSRVEVILFGLLLLRLISGRFVDLSRAKEFVELHDQVQVSRAHDAAFVVHSSPAATR